MRNFFNGVVSFVTSFPETARSFLSYQGQTERDDFSSSNAMSYQRQQYATAYKDYDAQNDEFKELRKGITDSLKTTDVVAGAAFYESVQLLILSLLAADVKLSPFRVTQELEKILQAI